MAGVERGDEKQMMVRKQELGNSVRVGAETLYALLFILRNERVLTLSRYLS